MNRIVLAIALISICCCPSLANICDNDNGPVVVIVKDKQNTGHSQTNRTPAKVPIECYYYPFSNSVELSFLSNLGAVTVSLENMTTGEIQEYTWNSSIDVMVIPIVPNSTYTMDIVAENGRSYFAQFFAGENDTAD